MNFSKEPEVIWMQNFLKSRISKNIILNINKNSQGNSQWIIKIDALESAIVIPFYPCFARTGNTKQIGCKLVNVFPFNNLLKRHYIHAPGLLAEASSINGLIIQSEIFLVYLNYDILGFFFWSLNRLEEINVEKSDLDQYSRFLYSSSHAFTHGYLDYPLVDIWIDLLSQIIEKYIGKFLPTPKYFSIQPTHDIDNPSFAGLCSNFQFGLKLFKHLKKCKNILPSSSDIVNFLKAKRNSYYRLSPADRYNTFEWLASENYSKGLSSYFNFMAGSSSTFYDTGYSIKSPSLLLIMKSIYDKGASIGIHPSFQSFKSPNLIKSEVNLLVSTLASNGIYQSKLISRMHYLRFDMASTPTFLASAGVHQDHTLGYANYPGFRCGTCHKYILFNIFSRESTLLEIQPMILMDTSLISSSYLGFDSADKMFTLISTLKSECRNVRGTFNFLWHNCHLDSPVLREIYIFCIS